MLNRKIKKYDELEATYRRLKEEHEVLCESEGSDSDAAVLGRGVLQGIRNDLTALNEDILSTGIDMFTPEDFDE